MISPDTGSVSPSVIAIRGAKNIGGRRLASAENFCPSDRAFIIRVKNPIAERL